MKVEESRQKKRERLRAGIALVGERQLEVASDDTRDELARLYLREHTLARVLALRYADCVRAALHEFPAGDVPDDLIECHVDALTLHDETFARRLFHSDDLVVRALRGTAHCVRRLYRWLDEGDGFTLAGRTFRTSKIARERTGDIDEEHARLEGAASLAEWRRLWLDNLPRSAGADVWNPEQSCFRHDFVAEDLIV